MASNTNEDDSFDTEIFIEEVRKLPCIWDYTSADYSNRIKKLKAWQYLCGRFCENFKDKEKTEKNKCAISLQKKWKSLRDSFNREMKKTIKTGSAAPKHRQYLYFNSLSFLQPIAERRSTESSIENVDQQQNYDESFADEPLTANNYDNENRSASKRKTKRARDKENEVIERLSSRLCNRLGDEETRVENFDSDKHFLLSLYEHFKAINNNVKIQAQIEILNVIQKYTQPQRAYSNYESTGRQYDEQFLGYPRFSNDIQPRPHMTSSQQQYHRQFQPLATATSSSFQNNNYQHINTVPPVYTPLTANSPESVIAQNTDEESIIESIYN